MYNSQQEHPLWKYPAVKYVFLLKQKDSAETVGIHDIFFISRFGLTICIWGENQIQDPVQVQSEQTVSPHMLWRQPMEGPKVSHSTPRPWWVITHPDLGTVLTHFLNSKIPEMWRTSTFFDWDPEHLCKCVFFLHFTYDCCFRKGRASCFTSTLAQT